MSDTKSKAVEMEEMLKQLLEMVQEIKKNQEDIEAKMVTKEDMKKFLEDMKNDLKSSQKTMKTKLNTEVEEKVQVVEEKVHIVEEIASSPKNEVKKEVKIIESEAEDNLEELKIENVDGAKPNGTTDCNEDATTDNAEHQPEYNDSAEGGPSGSVAAGSSSDIPKNEEETTHLQVALEGLELDEKINQERGEEDLRRQNEIAASTVNEQQGQDQTKKLPRSQEGPYAIVARLSDGIWRNLKRPRVKMRFVRLKLFEGSTDGVT